jgi:hypothetical protein
MKNEEKEIKLLQLKIENAGRTSFNTVKEVKETPMDCEARPKQDNGDDSTAEMEYS